MVLESTIVCVDNSEFSRNGDFAPSRFAAQVDSVNILCSAKVQSHPENTVGLLTTAGKSARILMSATNDLGKVFACLHDVKLDGASDLIAGIQKAQLALKHRQNVVQRQRIVAFISSPIAQDTETLVLLAKKLKKNSVAVDIVHVGDDTDGDNVAKLNAFHEAVNAHDNSHILHVEAGSGVLADVLMHSDIYADRDAVGATSGAPAAGAAAGAAAGSGGEGFEFGFDPAVDPELAMVLRMSMEEERARQEAAGRAAPAGDAEGGGGGGGGDAAAAAATPAAATSAPADADDDADLYGTGAPDTADMEVETLEDEAAMLQQAIAMSRAGAVGAGGSSAPADAAADEDEEMDEEMRRAIEMSKADFDEGAKKKDDK